MNPQDFDFERIKNDALIKLLGQRVIIIFAGTFLELQKGIEYSIGNEAKAVLYDSGIYSGKCSARILLNSWKERGKEFLKKWSDFYSSSGVGWFKIKDIIIDLETGKGIIQVEKSLLSEKHLSTKSYGCESPFKRKRIPESEEPACHFLTGFFTGVFEEVIGIKLECNEVKCIKKNDPYCEFQLNSY